MSPPRMRADTCLTEPLFSELTPTMPPYLRNRQRESAPGNLSLKCANAGLNCVDSVIAVNSNSNRHYKLHLTLCADVQAEMSLPSCRVSSRLTRARTEGRWETIR